MSDGSNPKDAADAKSGSDTESDTDLGAKEPDDGALAAMSQQVGRHGRLLDDRTVRCEVAA